MRHGRSVASLIVAILFAQLIGTPLVVGAQQAPPGDPPSAEQRALLEREQSIAYGFVRAAETNGFHVTLPLPQIVIRTVPSLSTYLGRAANVILIPQWTQIPQPMQSALTAFAGAAGMDGAAFLAFAFHRFFLVHEFAHWIEAQGTVLSKPTMPYPLNHLAHEGEANRIALAFWRETDPAYADSVVTAFRSIFATMRSPVPPGTDVGEYFRMHYEALGVTPDYGWFQLRLVLDAADESPRPTLRQLFSEVNSLSYR